MIHVPNSGSSNWMSQPPFLGNQKELQKLPMRNYKNRELLTKATDPKRIPGYVAAATNKGQAGHRDLAVQVVSVFESKNSGCEKSRDSDAYMEVS